MTTATLLPLTAVRCVIPVARIASVRSAGVRLVSPMTRPGSNPRASAGAESTDSRSPARNRSAPDATAPGGVITSGAPATASVATRSSARSAGPRRPCTRTVERHSSAARRSSPVSSTGAPTALRAPRASRSSIVPSRRARVSSSRPARTNGSPVTTTTAMTAARSAASASTPPRARSVACAAAATSRSTTSTRARMSGQRSGRARRGERESATTPATTAAAPATARWPRTVSPRVVAATTQARTAGPRSRRSLRAGTRGARSVGPGSTPGAVTA